MRLRRLFHLAHLPQLRTTHLSADYKYAFCTHLGGERFHIFWTLYVKAKLRQFIYRIFFVTIVLTLVGCSQSVAQSPAPSLSVMAAPVNALPNSDSLDQDASNDPAIGNNMQVQVKVEVNSSGEGEANASGWANGGGDAQVRVEASGPNDASARAFADGGGDAQVEVETTGPGTALAEVLTNGEEEADASSTAFRPSSAIRDSGNGQDPGLSKARYEQPLDPKAVVNGELVNLRVGPGTTYPVMGQVGRGREFQIIATNDAKDWWQVCCYDGQTAWIVDQYVDPTGNIQEINRADVIPPSPVPPSPTPTPTATPATPTAIPTPVYAFKLVTQARFEERITPRIFLYVSQRDEGLGGYRLRVTKNGEELPVPTMSFGGTPGYTWPLVIDRQRLQNMKVEFPGVRPEGQWQVQLIDASGKSVGPPHTFVLQPEDSRQEMYIHYELP